MCVNTNRLLINPTAQESDMTGIYDTCAECGAAITHPSGRGKARKYCSTSCQDQSNVKRNAAKALSPCCIEGCDKPANRISLQMCEAHYMRQRRNGTTEYVGHALPGKLVHSHGYLLQAAPDHPRSLGSYRAYEHRVVFTDAHGEGPFNCHWCGAVVTWGDMHVDHLDSDRANNVIDNLVASCPPCNQQRGHEKIMVTLRGRYGITVNGITRTLSEWAAEYGIARSSIAARIKAGWSAERAVTEPRGKFGPQSRKRAAKDGGG